MVYDTKRMLVLLFSCLLLGLAGCGDEVPLPAQEEPAAVSQEPEEPDPDRLLLEALTPSDIRTFKDDGHVLTFLWDPGGRKPTHFYDWAIKHQGLDMTSLKHGSGGFLWSCIREEGRILQIALDPRGSVESNNWIVGITYNHPANDLVMRLLPEDFLHLESLELFRMWENQVDYAFNMDFQESCETLLPQTEARMAAAGAQPMEGYGEAGLYLWQGTSGDGAPYLAQFSRRGDREDRMVMRLYLNPVNIMQIQHLIPPLCRYLSVDSNEGTRYGSTHLTFHSKLSPQEAIAHYQPLLEAYGSDGAVSTQPKGSGPELWQWQGRYALGDGYNLQLQVISVTRGGHTSRVEIYLS